MWLNILVSDQNRNIIFTNFAILTRVEKIPSQIITPFNINDDHMYYIIGIVQGAMMIVVVIVIKIIKIKIRDKKYFYTQLDLLER